MKPARLLAVALVAAAGLAFVPAASAHKGSPEYLSVIDGVAPAVPGLDVVMLDRGDRLQVTYHGSKPVVFFGYSEEPYLRFLPSGVVQRNALSPATSLNVDPTGQAPVAESADAEAPPRWETVSRDGRYEFHDHRIHWMGQQRPPIVKDPDKRTKVQDWRVPMEVAGTPGAVTGTLYWTPIDGGGPPVGAIVALVVLLVGAVVLVVVVRRRRAAGGDAGDGDEDAPGASAPREAW